MGMRSIIISTLAYGVVLVIVVVDLAASVSNTFRAFCCCTLFIAFPHVMQA